MVELFKTLLSENLIQDSYDGDAQLGENDLGWFITPSARVIIEKEIKQMTSTPEWARQKGLTEDTFEKQVGGTHYKQFKIQPAVYSEENGLSFLEGNVVKYVTRHQHKGGIADLEKAIHCLELLKEIHYHDGPKS